VILALSPNAVANALEVDQRLIRAAIDNGALPVYAIGTKRRILTSDIEAWLRSLPRARKRRTKPAAEATDGLAPTGA
jgi:excisionase family DNA binding protein